MQENYLLQSETARQLYEKVRTVPIYDYHCHLSPKEIWEDHVFTDIGDLWLSGDHYKWRLMRAAGIPEDKIRGRSDSHTQFLSYAEAIADAAGSPLYAWTKMELALYFGVSQPLSPETAEAIWKQANRIIKEQKLSPRKMIENAGVRFIATTDDAADPLIYHKMLREDPGVTFSVTPTFRTDNVLLIKRKDYGGYIAKLSEAADIQIHDLNTLKEALCRRMEAFTELGCRFSDVGIPDFPEREGSEEEAERAFQNALSGREIADSDHSAFLWQMYLFLGEEYRRRGMIMQLHLAVLRNINTPLFLAEGPDSGGDSIGDTLSGSHIAKLLNALHTKNALPETILYTLNPSMTAQLCSIAGSFPGVHLGAAWWFNDHKRGIREVLETVAEIHHIGSFLGMLTDSRSFLSYARHDYFRRILCTFLAELCDSGEFDGNAAELAEKICYKNIRRLIEK